MTDLREKTEHPKRVWLQLSVAPADEPNWGPWRIRKWSHEPFDGGAEYVLASSTAQIESAIRKLRILKSDFNMKGANATTMERAIDLMRVISRADLTGGDNGQ